MLTFAVPTSEDPPREHELDQTGSQEAEAAEKAEPTFEQWREKVLSAYEAELRMTRDQVMDYLTNRPYPRKIVTAALVVAAVMVVALVQSPKYFRAAVDLTRAEAMVGDGRYGEAISTLERLRKNGVKSSDASYLLGKTYLLVGMPEAEGVLMQLGKVSEAQNEELEAIGDRIARASPHIERAIELLNQEKTQEAAVLFEKALTVWPTSGTANFGLLNAYLGAHFQSEGDEYAARYYRQLRAVRKMLPEYARRHEQMLGPLDKAKAAYQLAEKGRRLLDQQRIDEAVSCCQAALRESKDCSRAHAYLAVAYARKYEATRDQSLRKMCVDEYKTAVKLNPNRSSVKPELGTLAKKVE